MTSIETTTDPATALATRRATARPILLWALAAGLTGDAFVRTAPIGANLTAWLLVAVVALATVHHRRSGAVPREAVPLLAVAALFALFVAVRGSEMLTLGNTVAAMLAIGFAAASAAPASAFDLARARVRDVIRETARLLMLTLTGAFGFLYTDAILALDFGRRRRDAATPVARALVVATVVSLVFVALLAQGDPVFARVTSNLFAVDIDFGEVIAHVFFTVFFGWPVLGFVAGAMRESAAAVRPDDPWRVLGRFDVVATLGILNAVFALFLAVQLRVLFGGMAYVQGTTGLTLAQYARSGFFTLAAAGGLSLAVLLVMHAMLRPDSPGIERSYRPLSLLTMALVCSVMVSAAGRMTLYVQTFGMSVDRLYTFAGMLWIVTVAGWFSLTILRGRPLRFARGALVSACGILLALDVANPEAFVVAYNARWARTGAAFDIKYPVTRLSADAVPALVSALVSPVAPLDARLTTGDSTPPCAFVRKLLQRWGPEADASSDGWTLAAVRARAVVREHQRALRARACATRAPT